MSLQKKFIVIIYLFFASLSLSANQRKVRRGFFIPFLNSLPDLQPQLLSPEN
jgi:hypothetical protein